MIILATFCWIFDAYLREIEGTPGGGGGGGRFPLCISDPFYFEFSEEDMGQIITGYKTHLLDL